MTTQITFKSANKLGDCPGYIAGESNKLGLIVIQEWWGVNEQIKKRAASLADDGFFTLVPDLYRGKVGKTPDEAKHLMDGLDWSGAIEDIRGAAQYLKSKGCKKVGVMGYCMGGAITIASTVHVEEVDAGSAYYVRKSFIAK